MEKKFFIWLGIVIILKQLVWMALIPAWQFPDEQAHFGQVQNYAENMNASAFAGPNTSKEIIVSEELLGTRRDGFGNNRFTYHPEYTLPLDVKSAYEIEKALVSLPTEYRTKREVYEATVYPPLYYILGASFYRIVYHTDILTRIFVVRFVNIPLFLGIVFFTSKIGKLLFEKKAPLQILLILLVSFQPMFSYVSAGTTSDNLYNFLGTLTLYICLLTVKQGLSVKRLLYSLTTAALLWITKPQGKLLFLLFGAVPLFSLVHDKKNQHRVWLSLFVFILLAFGYMIINLILGRQFLPEIPGLKMVVSAKLSVFDHLKWTLIHTYREVMPWYWGVFRWLSLTYPRTVHRTINWLVLLALIGIGSFIVKRKNEITNKSFLWFMIFVNLIYFLGLFTFDFLFTRSHQFSFGIQGRYYFPLIVSQLALLLIGWYSLISVFKVQKLLIALLGLAVIIFHGYAQFFVGLSYLAPTSVPDFFMQLGFYKPWFFKNSYLQILFIAYILSLFVFIWYYVRIWRNYEKNRT